MTRAISVFLAIVPAIALVRVAQGQQTIVDVRQGTDIAIAMSPDKRTMVIDLLGQLWQLPTTGGGAVPLTPAGERAKHPRFGPQGRRIVYERQIDGRWDIWLLELDTGRRTALTGTDSNDREPDFLGDSSVVFASDRTGEYSLWALDLRSGSLTQLTSGSGGAAFPSVSDAGAIAYVLQDGDTWSLRALSRESGDIELYTSDRRLSAPSWRPGGGVLMFNESDGLSISVLKLLVLADDPVVKTLTDGEDVFAVRAAWLSPAEYLYTADGQIWRRGVASRRRQPVHLFAGVAVSSGLLEPVDADFDDSGRRPALGIAGESTSGDGTRRVFSALGDLWLAEHGQLRQLTNDPFVELGPELLADSANIVFSSDRDGRMRLWIMDLESGHAEPLTGEGPKPFAAAGDPAGQRIAYLTTRGFGPWAPVEVAVLDRATREIRRVAAAGLDGRAGLEWATDGAKPVLEVSVATDDPYGRRTLRFGDDLMPLQSVVADAASSLARRRGSSEPDAVPSWKPATNDTYYVVQAGRLFDGIRGTYRRHVDIHVDHQRIRAIVGRDVLPLPERVIDARELTVTPGFIDIHTHESDLAGERLGRIWLAHGVTTVREVATDTGEAIARGEAWAAGRRFGPRVVVSPALLPTSPRTPPPAGATRAGDLVLGGRNLLAGPIHNPEYGADEEPFALSERGRWLAGLVRPKLALDLRSSPLHAQYQDVFSTVAQAGYVTNTAIASMSSFARLRQEEASSEMNRLFDRFYTADERRYWLDSGRHTDAARPRQDTIARLIRSGARVAIGTDAPVVPYGLGLHLELKLLAEAGIANDQVLRIATAEGALALGLDRDLGTLEAGKLADFVVIDGDPLERLDDTENIVAVVVGGRWIDRAALLELPASPKP